MTAGFLKKIMSRQVHTNKLTAVHRFVFSTAAPASGPAESGAPPLKPFQPIHRRPAPTKASRVLLGLKFSRSRCRRGPTHQAATKPAVPDDTWMTKPPAKSRTPRWVDQPPPQR